MGWKDDMLRAAADVAFKGAYSGPGYTFGVEFFHDESTDYGYGGETYKVKETYATVTVYRGEKPNDPHDFDNVVTSRRFYDDEIEDLWLGIMNHNPADYTDGF